MRAATPSSHPYTQKVRRYYDANTSVFRVLEPKGDTIHRAVWAEGIRSRRAALAFTNGLVAAEVTMLAERDGASSPRIVDLGCGTGGTFLFLADHLRVPWSGLAITLSPRQVARAEDNFRRRGLTARCEVRLGDYLHVPSDGPFDVAVAIESFVHCPEPAAFFREAARVLGPGGRLLLCDDLLSERAASSRLPPSEAACLRELSRGWLAPCLQSARAIAELGASAGLRVVWEKDLTPSLRLLRAATHPRGKALANRLLRLGALDHPLLRSLTGGLALQLALGQGLIEYRFTCFERGR